VCLRGVVFWEFGGGDGQVIANVRDNNNDEATLERRSATNAIRFIGLGRRAGGSSTSALKYVGLGKRPNAMKYIGLGKRAPDR